MLIDTHAHVNFKDFLQDYQEVIKRAQEKNIVMINVGSQISTSQRAVDLAQANLKTFAAVGLHPIQLESREIVEEGSRFRSRAEDFDPAAYSLLAQKEQVVAIGECGLDYYHIEADSDIWAVKQKQMDVLHQHIRIANENNLPLILHCRGTKESPLDAYHDLLSELKKDLPKNRGVLHSFGGDYQMAKPFLELGFYLGFNGIITFDKTGKSLSVLTQMPAERILAETDCPYLTPEPYRGQRNEPSNVEFVVKKIAEIRQIGYQQAADLTTTNAKVLFNLAV